jgi:hypothetical protein
MPEMDRVYHLTEAGGEALARSDCGLPQAIRELLGAVGPATYFNAIAASLNQYDERDILERLEDLEAIGLVESIALQWLAALAELGSYAPEPIAMRR